MGDVLDAITKFRRPEPLRYTGDDPGLLALAQLPLRAGLATRVRAMIEAGSTDDAVDRYIEGWIESATASPRQKLYAELDALHRGLHPDEK